MNTADIAAQPCREKNIGTLVSMLMGGAGAKPEGFGVEAVYTVTHEDGTPVTFLEEKGLALLMDQLEDIYPSAQYDEQDMLSSIQRMQDGVLEIVSYEGDGTLKLSAGPFADLMKSNAVFEAFRTLVAEKIAPNGQTIAQQSLMPTGIDALMRSRQKSTDEVGIELEQFILHGDLTRASYSEEKGIRSLLEAMAEDWDEKTYTEDGQLIGLARTVEGHQQNITLEPAGQIELSAGPYRDLNVAKTQFQDFEDELTKLCAARGQMPLSLGYMPVGKAEDMELIPKDRYRFMDKYLRQFGPYGTCMMRGSASTQVSIDFQDEADCKRKFKLANALGPVLALMCCNTVVFEDEPCKHIMMRTMVWNGVDRARCNVAPGTFSDDWTPRTYAEWLLDTPAITVADESGEYVYDERTFGEIFANRPMSADDAAHAASMVFPDVRLKGFIEIRVADSMPTDYAMALAALVKGLFSSEDALAQTEAVIGIDNIKETDVALAKLAMMEKGFGAQIYGDKKVDVVANRLHMVAKLHLNNDERLVLEPLTTLALNGYTLAELTDLMI